MSPIHTAAVSRITGSVQRPSLSCWMSLLDISISETYKGLQGKACPFTEHLTHAENFVATAKRVAHGSRSITGKYADAFPCETENVSSTIQPDCETALNSNNKRDLPTPGSAIAATICPCPDLACSAACLRASISRSRPTNLVSPRPAARCSRVRNGPSPVTSNTSTGSATPFIRDAPRDLSVK